MSVKYFFTYSDGVTSYKYFDNVKDAEWYAHNEGDHLIDWGVAS